MPKKPAPKKRPFRITADMVIGDVIRAFPQTIEVFSDLGIHCIGCYIANFESIEEGVSRHGIDPVFVIKKLNESIKPNNVRRSPAPAKSRPKKRNADLRRTRKPKS